MYIMGAPLRFQSRRRSSLGRAPHKREVRAVGLSVRTFMTRKYTRTVLIYGYLQLLIAAFKAGLVLSRKFCSAENFGAGPIFSGKIGSIFSEKNGPGPENFIPVYVFDCNELL